MIPKLKEKFTIIYFIILVKSALWLLKFKSRKSVKFKSKYLRDFDEDKNTVIDPWNPRIVIKFTNMSFAEDTDSVCLIIKPNKLSEFVTIRLEFDNDKTPISIPDYFICSVMSGITSYKKFFFNFKNLRNTLILIQIFYFAKYNLFGYFLDKKRKSFIAKAGRTSPMSCGMPCGAYGNVVDLDIIIMKFILLSIRITSAMLNDEYKCWSWDKMLDTGASYSFEIRLFECNNERGFGKLYFNFISTKYLKIKKSFNELKEDGFTEIQLVDIRKAILLKEPVENCLLRINSILEFSNEILRFI